MNIFVIGKQLQIHHYPDWSGSAFLCFQDEEYRIPGTAAKILVEAVLALQTEQRKLEERSLACTICGQPAGKALLPEGEGGLRHAMCTSCHEEMVKLRKLGVTQLAAAAAARASQSSGEGD